MGVRGGTIARSPSRNSRPRAPDRCRPGPNPGTRRRHVARRHLQRGNHGGNMRTGLVQCKRRSRQGTNRKNLAAPRAAAIGAADRPGSLLGYARIWSLHSALRCRLPHWMKTCTPPPIDRTCGCWPVSNARPRPHPRRNRAGSPRRTWHGNRQHQGPHGRTHRRGGARGLPAQPGAVAADGQP